MITRKQLKAALFAGAAVSFIATLANAAEWRLVDITGQVRIAVPGGTPAVGRLNQTLPTGTSVTTAGGGRATLDNGEQRIVVAPNSRLTVQRDQGGFTRIAQDLGAAMFKVDKRAAPHFRVDTPLLAAIVKGTTFTVMVEGVSDAVSVAEGLVEVRSNLNAGIGSDVGAGATGTVLRDAPGAVQLVTPASAPTGPVPDAVSIVPIDYKAASDGLIDIAPPIAQGGQEVATIQASAPAQSNNAIGASVQDSSSVATGGSVVAAVSQIVSLEAGQRETATQLASVAGLANGNNGLALGVAGNGNGNGNNGNGNGNGGSTAGNTVVAVLDPIAPAPGNSGNGNGNGLGNAAAGNGNSGNGNGNGGSNAGGAVVAVLDPVVPAAGNNGNGNGAGNGNGNNGNGNGNNGNGNNGNGNGNGGSSAGGAVVAVLDPVVPAAGNNGNGNGAGNGNGNNGNGNNGNGNNGNGNNGNGNGNGGSSAGGAVVAVLDPVVPAAGNNGNGNGAGNGNGNNGNGNNGNGNGNGGSSAGGAVVAVLDPVVHAAGNNGNGNGNGNGAAASNGGNGNGNAGVVQTVVNTVTDTAGGVLGSLTGNGNGNANGNNGNNGNGNGNGNSAATPAPVETASNGNGNGNANGAANGNGNGNSGNGNSGNGNGAGNVVAPVVTAVVETTTGLLDVLGGSGNSGNGNSGSGNAGGNGNSGNGNSGNGNGKNGG